MNKEDLHELIEQLVQVRRGLEGIKDEANKLGADDLVANIDEALPPVIASIVGLGG
jgi:hypothetical protein